MLGISISLSAQATWTQQNTNFTEQVPSTGVDQVDAVSPTIVWVKGFNGASGGSPIKAFSKTNDGGNTWTEGHFTQFPTTVMPYVIGAVDYNKAFCIAYDTVTPNYASFWKTVDGGTTWTIVTGILNTGSTTFADGVKFWDGGKGFCYGDPVSGDFQIYTTSDSGATWTQVPGANIPNALTSPSGEYGFNGADCAAILPGGTAFFITNLGRVFESTDYGIHWSITATRPFTPSVAYGSNKMCASSINNIIVSVFTTSSATWSWMNTTDGGATWNTYAPAAPFYTYAMCYVPGSSNEMVATDPDYQTPNEGVAYSTDGGLTWTDYLDATYLQPAGTNVQCLAVGFSDQQNGWVGNYDAGTTINSILYFHDPTAGVTLNSVNGNDVNVYPNPSNGLVHFSVNGPNKSDINIKVFDMVGNMVFNEKMNVNDFSSTQFDFSGYAKGMYMMQITSGNDIKTQKLVIR